MIHIVYDTNTQEEGAPPSSSSQGQKGPGRPLQAGGGPCVKDRSQEIYLVREVIPPCPERRGPQTMLGAPNLLFGDDGGDVGGVVLSVCCSLCYCMGSALCVIV